MFANTQREETFRRYQNKENIKLPSESTCSRFRANYPTRLARTLEELTASGNSPTVSDLRREGDELATHVKSVKEQLEAELKTWWDEEKFVGRVLEPLLKAMAPHVALQPAGGVGDLVLMFDETNVEKVHRERRADRLCVHTQSLTSRHQP